MTFHFRRPTTGEFMDRTMPAANPIRCPYAVLISGPPATGKSTLAAALAPRLGAAVIDLDVATGPLTTVVSNLIGVADLGNGELARLTRGPRYETLFALAEENLRAGMSVVLVAPFTVERSADGWNAVVGRLQAHAAAIALVWLHLPPDRLVDRLKQRDAARDTDKVKNPAAFLAALDRDPPAAPHLALDATRPVADLVDSVVARVTADTVAIDGMA
jgi:predicted kinase